MRKFKVYHKKELMYRYTEADAMTVFDPDLYEWVADVHTDRMGMVFQLTNHIDTEWWENDEVKIFKQSRSTSIGDVVYDVEADIYHLCMPMGWKELMSQETSKTSDLDKVPHGC